MSFSDKLIKLRKEKGLSQEELGYQLNVTRQTVSKWELGQTTPEMDKLVELSKIFGVTIDELTSETENNNEIEQIEDKPINDTPKKHSTLKAIVFIILIFLIVGVIIFIFLTSKIFSFGKGILNMPKELFNTNIEFSAISNIINDQINQTEIDMNQMEIDSFNSKFESYSGTNSGFHLEPILDRITTNNKKEKDRIITVVYNEESYSEPEKITDLKHSLDDNTKYETSFEYGEDGYIYQLTIEDI